MSTIPESHRDLTHHGVGYLATIGPDGLPQVTAVGFLFDDGAVRITVSDARQKLKNLQRDPSCTFFISDGGASRTVELRGKAELIPDPGYEWAGRVAGANGSSADDVRARDRAGDLRYCISLRPTKVNVWPPERAA